MPPSPVEMALLAAQEAEQVPSEDEEVMPAVKPLDRATATLCDWACDDPVMTAEEGSNGYCSGRRSKAKMHHFCFLKHAGEAGLELGCYMRYCRACWAEQ